ncbi:MAG: periplasmic heavy metal sensor [Gemmatimonadales bacterium]
MNRIVVAALALTLLAVTAGAAQQAQQAAQPAPNDPVAAALYPPELVMQHQRRLALTAAQRSAITEAVAGLQAQVLDLQWRMQDEVQRLAELLGAPRVDAAAALAQADQVFDLERQVKRAHLTLLIRIKNSLTPEQQATLRELRGKSE